MATQLHFAGIVLKKTKLGEADLIVTFLAQDGSCLQAVARGARKPKNAFAARLELFSSVELFCAETKGLPLVQEARLVNAHSSLRLDFDRSTAASVVAELVAKCIHENVPTPRLFQLIDAFFSSSEKYSEARVYPLALATCLKVFAFIGIRPRFVNCAICGQDLRFSHSEDKPVAFSALEGGCLCSSCAQTAEVIYTDANLVRWLNVLLHETFERIQEINVPAPALSYGFHFVQDWMRVHVGAQVKSIPYLLTNATFSDQPC